MVGVMKPISTSDFMYVTLLMTLTSLDNANIQSWVMNNVPWVYNPLKEAGCKVEGHSFIPEVSKVSETVFVLWYSRFASLVILM